MCGDKIKGQAPIKLNEWNLKRGKDILSQRLLGDSLVG